MKCDWMRRIPDDTKLSQLSIPGTHDTMTSHNNDFCIGGTGYLGWCLTQEWHLKEQLEHGVRFIDIRIQESEKEFFIYHGPVYLDVTLEQVFKILIQFLKNHPTETVS